uniref:Uncharacterized protein n=1 Tax=Anguilla anguilla TaxID=7936 RepID=A0A0E9XAD5_ANGAN
MYHDCLVVNQNTFPVQ